MRKIICITLAVVTAMVLCSCKKIECGKGEMSENSKKISRTDTEFSTGDKDDESNAIDGFAGFMLNLFKNSENDGGNYMISPMSVLTALAMTMNGADGETLEQMLSVLGDGVISDAGTFNDELVYYTNSLIAGRTDAVSVANSLWIKDKADEIVPSQSFLDVNAKYYGAEIYKAPFDDTTVNDINIWVNDKTKGRIPEMISELDENTLMCLINAMTFDGEWVDPFYEYSVRDGVFTTADGTEQKVTMMHSEENYYIKDDNATGFIKKYNNGFSFVALLPDEGVSVEAYVDSLTGERFLELVNNPVTGCAVDISLPKFEHEYSIVMNEVLEQMGMEDAFNDEEADFSNVYTHLGYGNLYIGSVVHKTYIGVNELGTEAGAVTEVLLETKEALPGELYKVDLDRPFVYAITDDNTGLPLFIGVVNEI